MKKEKRVPEEKKSGEKDKSPSIKSNPNPRANANLPADKKNDRKNQQGVGSEITDGEDG